MCAGRVLYATLSLRGSGSRFVSLELRNQEIVEGPLLVLGYLERSLQERTIPIADNITANAIKTAKSVQRLAR